MFYEVWLSLVEHYVRDVGVARSNLVTPTKRTPVLIQYLSERVSFLLFRDVENRELRNNIFCQMSFLLFGDERNRKLRNNIYFAGVSFFL